MRNISMNLMMLLILLVGVSQEALADRYEGRVNIDGVYYFANIEVTTEYTSSGIYHHLDTIYECSVASCDSTVSGTIEFLPYVTITHWDKRYPSPYAGIYFDQPFTLTVTSICTSTNSSGVCYNNKKITSVIIPSTVTSIGYRAFLKWSNLMSVSIPNSVTAISSEAFKGCSSLESIAIPNSVTYIGPSAFEACSGLTSVTIPNSVKEVCYNAFKDCTSLTSATVGKSVETFGMANYSSNRYGVFEGCTNLKEINWNAINCEIAYLGASKSLERLNFGNEVLRIPERIAGYNSDGYYTSLKTVNIGNSVQSIGNSAFCRCTGLTSISMPNSIQSIDDYAFSGCTGLTNVTIPDAVQHIGERAFSGCSNIRYLTMPNPDSVTVIEWNAFAGCTSLNRVYCNDLAAWCRIKFNSDSSNPLYYAHRLFVNGEDIIDLVVPNSVERINDYAFSDFTGITSVTLPNSVKSIGDNAFLRCSGLTSMTIGNSVTAIGNYAFSNCSALSSLSVPNSVTSIGGSAFYRCNGLKSISIGNSVKSIGSSAFAYCTGLSSVTINDLAAWCKIKFNSSDSNPLYYAHRLYLNGNEIEDLVVPNSVDSISNNAFCYCYSLKNVTIPNQVAYIGQYAFMNCSGITSANIGNSVIEIDKSAFYNCQSLTTLSLGSSLTYLRGTTFSGCNALSTIYSKSKIAPSMDASGCFGYTGTNSVYSKATVYVPIGSKRDYELTNYWNLFSNIVEMNMDETPGDVDGDGKLSIEDVTSLISLLLSGGDMPDEADVDGDGRVNIDDVVTLIGFLLSGN